MVKAGEQSGALEEVLRRMSGHFARFAEAQGKFKSAMVYPLLVCLVGVALVWFFMTKVLPQFLGLFASFDNVTLPMTTQVLVNTSRFLAKWWWLLLVVGSLLALLFVRYKASPSGRRTVDRLKLKLPVVGRVVQLNLFGQFAQTLGTLMRNGVPVLNALRITEQVVPNVILGEAIAKTREGVTDGKTLAQPLAKSGVFPQLMIDLIKIGEETGDVPGALENVADTYDRELNLALKAMSNLIEPIMIILIAVVIGFILLGVIQAMFAITQNIQR
jgi:type II secretory pathway component PulF